MSKLILLDSGPLSILTNPAKTPETLAMTQWAIDCDLAGHEIIVPEIIDYELRRVFLLGKKAASIVQLDNLKANFIYLPLTTPVMLKAAELWAETRQKGKPTAHEDNIDVDVILAAQALTLGAPQSRLIVATSNVRHIAPFVPADLWSNITP